MSQVCFYSLLALLFISNLFSTVKCDNTGKFSKQSIRSVDVYKTEVFGPGLQPDKIVLPVRFFYILPRDAYGFRFVKNISNFHKKCDINSKIIPLGSMPRCRKNSSWTSMAIHH